MIQETPNGLKYDLWALQRPLTKHWGSGGIFKRIVEALGPVDVVFGKTDGIPDDIFYVDHSNGYEWLSLPFEDNQFSFGYWDPPYDRMYKPEGKEIWRTCRKIAVLHTMVYPTSWFVGAKRTGMIAVTYGPLKAIRCLQIFEKT